MELAVDHVVFCVTDLGRGRLLAAEAGLTAVEGGRHPGHGTANLIVPLGSAYLELLAIADPAEAAESPFGRWASQRSSDALRPHLACLRPDDLQSLAGERGLALQPMSRQRSDGSVLRWRLAGLDEAIRDGLPFFIEWESPADERPGSAPVDHASGVERISEVTLSGDPAELGRLVQGSSGVSVAAGPPGVARVRLTGGGRTVFL